MGLVVTPEHQTQRLEKLKMATCKTCNGSKTISCPVLATSVAVYGHCLA